jgi:hypothetical protein
MCLQSVFSRISSARKNGVHTTIRVTYIEIYNEEALDLLGDQQARRNLAIRERADGAILITGANEAVVTCAADALALFDAGNHARTVGPTNMNAQSSRSHAIMTVTIEQQQLLSNSSQHADAAEFAALPSEWITTTAKFHLARVTEFHIYSNHSLNHVQVDLAGSERNKRTGNAGLRFKESVTINAGLLALGNVISALSDPKGKKLHVPYRESKLTRLLQDSLGGNSRTLMVACISPADVDFEETLNTLKYAQRARFIRNRPTVNIEERTEALAAAQAEIERLRQEIAAASDPGLRSSPSLDMQHLQLQLIDEKDASQRYRSNLLACKREREALQVGCILLTALLIVVSSIAL